MQAASKVILLGKSNVGKTCLIHRYINKVHTDSSIPTIGQYVWPKDEVVRGKSIRLQVWDTAGLERFDSLDEMHYRNVVAVILCYDITDNSSFDRACFWSWQIKQRQMGCKVFLCGTKKDLVDDHGMLRMVTSETIQPLVDGLQAAAFEVSSKTGENVGKLILSILMQSLSSNSTQTVAIGNVGYT